jgi:6-phosphofructokinase 1
MKFAILTGGGDVPGLNPCIQTVVHRVVDGGHSIVGIRRGWGGLLNLNPDDPDSISHNLLPLDRQVVRAVDRFGGTFLHTSRTNPARVKPKDTPPFLQSQRGGEERQDFTSHVLHVIERMGIDVLITIGGDDTLSYSLRLHNEGVPVVAIPKTMDNDVYGTDYCIGFSTAVTRSVQAIDDLRSTAGSHERIAVVELFGRYSGETTLITAYLAAADRAVIPEVLFDDQRLAALALEDKRANPSGYAMIVISEGAQLAGGEMVMRGVADAYGHRKLGGIGEVTAELIKKHTGQDVLSQPLSYLMRSGPPDTLDRMVARNYGELAAELALAGSSGEMVALQKGAYVHVPLALTGEGKKQVRIDRLYDSQGYRPRVRGVAGLPMFLD